MRGGGSRAAAALARRRAVRSRPFAFGCGVAGRREGSAWPRRGIGGRRSSDASALVRGACGGEFHRRAVEATTPNTESRPNVSSTALVKIATTMTSSFGDGGGRCGGGHPRGEARHEAARRGTGLSAADVAALDARRGLALASTRVAIDARRRWRTRARRGTGAECRHTEDADAPATIHAKLRRADLRSSGLLVRRRVCSRWPFLDAVAHSLCAARRRRCVRARRPAEAFGASDILARVDPAARRRACCSRRGRPPFARREQKRVRRRRPRRALRRRGSRRAPRRWLREQAEAFGCRAPTRCAARRRPPSPRARRRRSPTSGGLAAPVTTAAARRRSSRRCASR